jgi:hypothetical protein
MSISAVAFRWRISFCIGMTLKCKRPLGQRQRFKEASASSAVSAGLKSIPKHPLLRACFQINRRIDCIIVSGDYSYGRCQMIKQRLNQAARALLREFWAEDSLGDCQTVSKVDHNRDELIRLQSRGDFRRPQEVPDEVTSVANLLPMHFNKALPDTFASKSSNLEFSTKHDPIMVRHQVGDGVPHSS